MSLKTYRCSSSLIFILKIVLVIFNFKSRYMADYFCYGLSQHLKSRWIKDRQKMCSGGKIVTYARWRRSQFTFFQVQPGTPAEGPK